MLDRPDRVLLPAAIGGAGAVWGLGLARLGAEAGFLPWLFISPVAAVALAAGCAALAVVAGRRQRALDRAALTLAPLALPILYVTGLARGVLAGCVLAIGAAIATLLLARGERARWGPPTILALVVLAVFLRTLLPGVGEADTFEFQVVVPKLRVAHPTGYPLYILLGKLFTLLPVANVAWRVSLASAVFATLAVLALYALLLRLSAHRLAAFFATLAFAFSATFWSQAVVAEVYTLHNLLAAALLWVLLARTDRERGASAARHWQAAFLLLGLGLANHLTTLLLLPALALGLIWERPRLTVRDWLVALCLLAAGLAIYLYIPLRWPAVNQGERMTLLAFARYVSGGQFHGALRLAGWRDPVRWEIVGRVLQRPFGWGGLGLAALGVAGLAVRHKRALALTGLSLLAHIAYGLAYHVPDISVFLLPAHLILAIWMGAGVAYVAQMAPQVRRLPPLAGRLLTAVPLAALVALSLSRLWLNLPLVDRSGQRGGRAWGRYALSLPLTEEAAVLADVKKFAPLYYVQQIEGLRPDLDLVLLGSEALYQAELASRTGAGQTVYLARFLPHLEGHHLRSVGPLVEVGSAPLAGQPEPAIPLDVTLGAGVRLLGLDAERLTIAQGDSLRVTLHWSAQVPPQDDLLVHLRLVDGAGEPRWESVGARPVSGLYSTLAWRAGERVPDFHEVPIPASLAPGAYTLQVALSPPFAGGDEQASDTSPGWMMLTEVTVAASDALEPLPADARALFGRAFWLTGYDMPVQATVGAPVIVTLAWRAAQPEPGATPRLSWVDEAGQWVGTSGPAEPAGERDARQFQVQHAIDAPATPGTYGLAVGWAGAANAALPARCHWLAAPAGACVLGAVDVIAAEGLANYANLVLLASAEVGQTSAQAGDVIGATFRWRALKSIEQDYTIFVQLLGPDGRLHGQVDAWPVQGTLPTSQWAPGDEVVDRHAVRLDADAPSGRYQVHAGWYLLETMERLQIVGGRGHPVGDSLVVGELDVGR